MRKIIIGFIMIVLLFGGGLWLGKYVNKSQNNINAQNYTSNYQAKNTNTSSKTNKGYQSNEITVAKKETEIAVFSTKIYNKDAERQNNIGITCRALTTKEIQPGEVFSFCDNVGKATTDKGYKEADIYVDGKKEQGLGGGNCQVSTTLYNAVLQVPELEVIERHQHSGHVPYVEKGKDAAVAYGAYDFKFKNNTQNVIKILLENTTDNITAKVIKIEQ